VQRLFDGARANLVITLAAVRHPARIRSCQWLQARASGGVQRLVPRLAANIQAILAPDGSYFLNIKAHADEGERNLYVMGPRAGA